jgi:CHAD domain-containing protein
MEQTDILIKQNPVFRFADQRLTLALQHLNTYLMHYDPEELHELRVEMKRIKAIHYLLKQIEALPDEAKYYPLQLSLFYKISGKVRAAHLMKARMSRRGWDIIASGLFKKLFKRQIKFNKLLIKEAESFEAELKKWGGTLVKSCADIDLGKFEQQVAHEKQALTGMLQPVPDEADWHELRKAIKRFTHASEMLSVRALARIKEGIDLKKITTLQELLGDWNDATEQSKWIKKQLKCKAISKDAYHIIQQVLSEKLLQNRLKIIAALKL